MCTDNLQKDLIWKSQYKFICHKTNVYFQNLNEIKKGYLIYSTRTYYARYERARKFEKRV